MITMRFVNILSRILIIAFFFFNNIVFGYEKYGNVEFKKQVLNNKHFGFHKTKKMNYKHSEHIAVLLPNGKVLIRDQRTAEIFDPETNMFKKLQEPSFLGLKTEKFPEYSVMKDGQVLIWGSSIDYSKHYPIEVFDYKTEKFRRYEPSLPYNLSLIKFPTNFIEVKILSPEYLFISYSLKDIGYRNYIYNYSTNKYILLPYSQEEYGDVLKGFIYDKKAFFISQKNGLIIISQYSIEDKNLECIAKLDFINHNFKISFIDKKIFFFTGQVREDDTKQRENMKNFPIYSFDVNTKKFETEYFLHSGGCVEFEILDDGRILFNSGKFDGNYVKYEIYDPKEKKSFFTGHRPWYRRVSITKLKDGSLLFSGGWTFVFSHNGTKDAYRYYP